MIKNSGNFVVKLMVTIVDRKKGKKIIDILDNEDIHMHFVCLGKGTATSEILDFLGIGETNKDVVISLVPDYKIPVLHEALLEKMHLKKPGRGISFTLPLSGISSLICQFLTQEHTKKIDNGVNRMNNQINYDLILTIINKGYTDQVMAAAKGEGAKGGTVIHARGIDNEKVEKFLGISIQPEKEIVIIIANREHKQSIMKAINQQVGLKTPGRGIVISLPVDSMIGFD